MSATQVSAGGDRGKGEDRAARGEDRPGAGAAAPTDIPARGWWQVLRRAWREGNDDNVGMLAGGVAFFAFLSLFPALIAAVSVYGLVVSPQEAQQQIQGLAAGLPPEAQQVLTGQLGDLAGSEGLGIGLVVSVALALWSASGGTANLMKAVNIAYDENDERNFVKKRAIALALTLGAIVFVLLAVALIAVAPGVLAVIELGPVAAIAVQVVRWLLILVLVTVALAVVYRFAPDRDDPRVRWVSLGAAIATVVWIIGSVGFSLYVRYFGSYQETYGAIAGVAIVLLWLYLTAYIVLLGAEVNSESERQTDRDTTVGRERPVGQRGAVAADTKPA